MIRFFEVVKFDQSTCKTYQGPVQSFMENKISIDSLVCEIFWHRQTSYHFDIRTYVHIYKNKSYNNYKEL